MCIRDSVDFVESTKSLLGERGRRTQLAGTKCGERPTGRLNNFGSHFKTTLEELRSAKPHPLNLVAMQSRHPARILEWPRNEPIAAGCELTRHRHACCSCSE